MDSRRANQHFVIGIIILFVGIVLLLDQLGFSEANRIFLFWPLILIYFGIRKLLSSCNMVSRFWGGFITLLGISFQLEELGLRGIHFFTIWPVLLICAGVLLVLKHYESRSAGYYAPPPIPPPPPGPPSPNIPSAEPPTGGPTPTGFSPPPPAAEAQAPPPQSPPPPNYGPGWDPNAWRQKNSWQRFQRRMNRFSDEVNNNWQQPHSNWQPNMNWHDSSQPRLDDVHIFWGGRRRIISKNFMGGEIVAIFGGFDIDLTQADFPGDQVEIEIVSIFGGGEIRVPATWEVIVDSVGIFGGTTDRTWHPQSVPAAAAPATPAKKLIIKGVAIFGGLTIKN